MTSEPDEEFQRGPEVSFTFAGTPEQVAVLKAWSERVPTLYFLDICAADVAKRSRETFLGDAKKLALFDRLKALDKPQNSFSYLLAFIEKVNDPRSTRTDADLTAQILSDVAKLRAFFDHAQVVEPDQFLANALLDLRGLKHELNQDAYLAFLRGLVDPIELWKTVANAHRLQKAKEIFALADSLSVRRNHQVVLVALACLYGNDFARRLMKFTDDVTRYDPVNPLADIMTIVRFLPRKLEVEHIGREQKRGWPRSLFITDDRGLAQILSCFTGNSVKSVPVGDDYETRISGTIALDQLLPELPIGSGGAGSEYEQLLALLSQS
jgi:hypothetical protein